MVLGHRACWGLGLRDSLFGALHRSMNRYRIAQYDGLVNALHEKMECSVLPRERMVRNLFLDESKNMPACCLLVQPLPRSTRTAEARNELV
jgi:hypothetical protein